MPTTSEREYRALGLLAPGQGERRLDTDRYVEGYAATFGAPYVLFRREGVDYLEEIHPHALEGADLSDVIFQYDHQGRVLARSTNGTLLLTPDSHGLLVAADLSKSGAARSLYEEIGAGLVTKMSWAFTVAQDSYNRDTHTRTILKIGKVYDVSAVSYPANPSTDIAARACFDGVLQRERAEGLAAERKRRIIKLLLEV